MCADNPRTCSLVLLLPALSLVPSRPMTQGDPDDKVYNPDMPEGRSSCRDAI